MVGAVAAGLCLASCKDASTDDGTVPARSGDGVPVLYDDGSWPANSVTEGWPLPEGLGSPVRGGVSFELDYYNASEDDVAAYKDSLRKLEGADGYSVGDSTVEGLPGFHDCVTMTYADPEPKGVRELVFQSRDGSDATVRMQSRFHGGGDAWGQPTFEQGKVPQNDVTDPWPDPVAFGYPSATKTEYGADYEGVDPDDASAYATRLSDLAHTGGYEFYDSSYSQDGVARYDYGVSRSDEEDPHEVCGVSFTYDSETGLASVLVVHSHT